MSAAKMAARALFSKLNGPRNLPRSLAARSPCSHPAAAETSWPTTGMPSIVMNRTGPTFVGSVTGSKRSLSSAPSNKHKPSEKAKMADQKDQFEQGGHDFTPSVWLNSFAAWTMYAGLYVMIYDN